MGFWQRFFDGHAPHYMENVFVRNTVGEVDFIEVELGLAPGVKILDVGCGTGRHSVELARRGYRVTGVDLSAGMLAQARVAAQAAAVTVDWIHEDAKAFRSAAHFDGAVCLCEGGMGLIEADEDPMDHDGSVLRSIALALKPGAPFLLTALNGYRAIRAATDDEVAASRFDPATMEFYEEGEPDIRQPVPSKERPFIAPEMARLLSDQGFEVLHIWGGTAGAWDKRPVKLDEIEAMFVCRRLP